MSIVAARFNECRPTPWNGRYARIPGDCPVFHLKPVNGDLWPVILWDTDDGRGTCKAVHRASQPCSSRTRGRARSGGQAGPAAAPS